MGEEGKRWAKVFAGGSVPFIGGVSPTFWTSSTGFESGKAALAAVVRIEKGEVVETRGAKQTAEILCPMLTAKAKRRIDQPDCSFEPIHYRNP